MDSWIPLKNIERYLSLLARTVDQSDCAILRELIAAERRKLVEAELGGED